MGQLNATKLKAAAELVDDRTRETLTFHAYPSQHWIKLRASSSMERPLEEARRRTKVVGAFLDRHSASMLVAACLRHISVTNWGPRKSMSMKQLEG